MKLYFKNRPSVITVKGVDARDFLQRMTTADFKKFKMGANQNFEMLRGAFTRANGSSRALFEVAWDGQQTFHLLVDPPALKPLLVHIENLHFGEELTYRDESGDFTACYIRRGEVSSVLPTECWTLPSYLVTPKTWDLIFAKNSPSAPSGNRESDFIPISQEDWHAFRALAGRPTWSVDLKEDQLVLEFPLDEYVHRNKGCYPGQEVLERLYTYGNAAKLAVVLQESFISAPVQNLPESSFVRRFEFSNAIPLDDQPRAFILAVILRPLVSGTALYDFPPSIASGQWAPVTSYLDYLVATRSEAKSL